MDLHPAHPYFDIESYLNISSKSNAMGITAPSWHSARCLQRWGSLHLPRDMPKNPKYRKSSKTRSEWFARKTHAVAVVQDSNLRFTSILLLTIRLLLIKNRV